MKSQKRAGQVFTCAVGLVLFALCSRFAAAQTPMGLVSITPCRAVDTRLAAGTFGGPTIQQGTSRTFPLLSSSCGLPSTASAYVLNVTVVPQSVLGYLTVWPAGQAQPPTSTLNDLQGGPIANGAIVGAGTDGAISVFGSNATDVVIDVYGYFVPQTTPTSTGNDGSAAGVQNTAVGADTLQANSGTSNTAVGASSLAANGTGSNNTAVGANALMANALGLANTALGANTLLNNLVGNDNVGVGFNALGSNTTGSNNVAVGVTSLWNVSTGGSNVAIGSGSLYADTLGGWNIAVGYQAGNAITTGNYNIDIGNSGTASDSGVIRIGSSANQNSTYISGIATSAISGVAVLINANGQLGVQTSSERFKEDVKDVGTASDRLYELRPVTFRYRADTGADPTTLQYGLIAEEVEKIYPELVIHDKQGRPYALAYQELPTLLLGALQKQQQTIESLHSQLMGETEKVEELSRQLVWLEKNAVYRSQIPAH